MDRDFNFRYDIPYYDQTYCLLVDGASVDCFPCLIQHTCLCAGALLAVYDGVFPAHARRQRRRRHVLSTRVAHGPTERHFCTSWRSTAQAGFRVKVRSLGVVIMEETNIWDTACHLLQNVESPNYLIVSN